MPLPHTFYEYGTHRYSSFSLFGFTLEYCNLRIDQGRQVFFQHTFYVKGTYSFINIFCLFFCDFSKTTLEC